MAVIKIIKVIKGMTMQILYAVVAMAFVFGCDCGDPNNLRGWDVCLYKDTPAWEVALAIKREDTSAIRELLAGKSDSLLNYQESRFGQSLIEWSVRTDRYASTKVLAELGADPNLQSYDGTSAFIHAAANFDTSKYVRLLLKYGGDVNAVAQTEKAQRLRTPLIAASFYRLESVKLLVEAGADIEYRSIDNQTPLIKAAMANQIDIVYYLILEKGARFDYLWKETYSGDSVFVVDLFRDMRFSLDSEYYKIKMAVVQYMKERGVDYWATDIPPHYYNIHDSAYLEKY